MSLSGKATSLNVGTYSIIVTGTDSKNESTSTSFEIDVQKNYVPVVQKQIDDQQLDLNQLFNLQLDKDTFVDPNGDNMTYAITSALPKWLKFTVNNLTFNGTPQEYGTFNISITAKDAWNATATMTFEIVAGIKPNLPPQAKTSLVG